MSHLTNYAKHALLNAHLRGIQYASPQNVYVGLFVGETEVTGGAYVRQQVTFTEPVEGQLSNSADIFFPVATASWGKITRIGIFDAQTNGNMLWIIPAEIEQTIDISQQYKIPKNYLVLRIK